MGKTYDYLKLLDIHEFDAHKQSMHLGSKEAYFNHLSNFTTASEIIMKRCDPGELAKGKLDLIPLTADISSLQRLLNTIGAVKLATSIQLPDSYFKTGNFAAYADRLTKSFSEIASLRSKIIRTEKPSDVPARRGPGEDPFDGISEEAFKTSSLKRILAVDDMPDVLRTIKAMLKDHYAVFGVTDYPSAVKVLNSKPVDLILLDIEMPAMDGFAMMHLFRQLPGYENIPIVFLTSNVLPETIKTAISMEANDYIRKPVDVEVLAAKLQKVFDDKAQKENKAAEEDKTAPAEEAKTAEEDKS